MNPKAHHPCGQTDAVTRRGFLVAGAAAGGALIARPDALAGWWGGPKRPDLRGKVALGQRKGLATASRGDLRKHSAAMLDRAVCQLTSVAAPTAAWRALFSSSDRVGIKINCLGGPRLSSRRGVVEGIIEGLRKADVADDNIVIFDRFDRELTACGYDLNHTGGVRCFGTDSLRGSGYEEKVTVLPHMGSCLSKILTRFCTAVVNVPILKDHDLAGLSGAMKNFFGVIHNPNKYHLNHCDPYVAELAMAAEIRGKVRLTVCDAVRPEYDGGPSYKPRTVWPYNGLIVSGDMLALDRVSLEIIEAKRREKGLPTLADAGRPPLHLDTAAKLGVGEGDPAKIQRFEV